MMNFGRKNKKIVLGFKSGKVGGRVAKKAPGSKKKAQINHVEKPPNIIVEKAIVKVPKKFESY